MHALIVWWSRDSKFVTQEPIFASVCNKMQQHQHLIRQIYCSSATTCQQQGKGGGGPDFLKMHTIHAEVTAASFHQKHTPNTTDKHTVTTTMDSQPTRWEVVQWANFFHKFLCSSRWHPKELNPLWVGVIDQTPNKAFSFGNIFTETGNLDSTTMRYAV